MRTRTIHVNLAVWSLVAVLAIALVPVRVNALPAGDPAPVYRFYKFKDSAHFFTSSEYEKSQVQKSPGVYTYEGVAFYSYPSQVTGSIPVHRFYNFKTGIHFYTAVQTEATHVNNTASHTYRYEGIAYYALPADVQNTARIHRFYNYKQGVHFYTANQGEASYINDHLHATYKYEGVAYYLPNQADAPAANAFYLSSGFGAVNAGETFSTTVRVTSGTEDINAVQASLLYDPNKLELVSVSEGSAFPMVAATNTTSGLVQVARGTSSGTVEGDNAVVTLTFKMLATSGSATISFDNDMSLIARGSDSANILDRSAGAIYWVK